MNLRTHQARAAKRHITESALRSFVDHGYVGTTMREIAEEAGVARQTLYNLFDSKAALLLAVVNDRVVGAEERSQPDDHRSILATDHPEAMIERFAESSAAVVGRALPVLRTAYEAAAVDGEVAKEIRRNEERRYEAQSFFVEALAEKGFLRTDTPIGELKRGFWLTSAPDALLKALDAGWDLPSYVRWLTRTLAGLLLPPQGER